MPGSPTSPAKRPAQADLPETPAPKKQRAKKTDKSDQRRPTIPISRGRFKNHFLRKHSTLLHNTKEDDRPKGLLVTCPVGAETRALGQIRNFLDLWLPRFFPDHKSVWTSRPSALDIDLEIVGEEPVAPREDSSTRRAIGKSEDHEGGVDAEADPCADAVAEPVDRRFQAIDSACAGMLFIRFRVDTCPCAFALALFEHLESCSAEERAAMRTSISYCSRILPITHTMPSNLLDITAHLTPALQELLPMSTTASSSLAFVTEIRNCPTLKSATVRDTALRCVPEIDARKIDLKAPDLVLFLSIFKSVAGLGVLRDYYRFKKYNVQLIGGDGK
ncbi:hypothetical protein HDU87_000228 [Geranomyces variabilis]|uniref:THUMP domain-containing protein n=1 Tax=Geranomyces variabilis TaxID=109894 RepID=A0AAD5TS91_9FUNG|nr:hypothetical protein HDU87_000228 [Geranomyces variabilis]